MKKYKFTDEFIKFKNKKLYRIEALRTFGDVKKGDKGGFIEKEENLSHNDSCWIYDDSLVYDEATVYDNAIIKNKSHIHDNAKVFGNAKVYEEVNIFENANISGEVAIKGTSSIYGSAKIFGNVKISGSTKVFGNASITASVLISDKAKIYGSARITGKAVIKDNAQIFDNAAISDGIICENSRVYDNAEIHDKVILCGKAKVHGNAKIYDEAKVYDEASVFGNAVISGKSKIYGSTSVFGKTEIKDYTEVYENSSVCGESLIGGHSKIYGYAQVLGDSRIKDNAEVREYEIVNCGVVDGNTKLPEEIKIVKEKYIDVVENKETLEQSVLIEEKHLEYDNTKTNKVVIKELVSKEKEIVEKKDSTSIEEGDIVLYRSKMFYVRKVDKEVIEGYKISNSLIDLIKVKNAINLNYESIGIDVNDELLILDNSYFIKCDEVEKVLGYAGEKLKKQVDDSVEFLRRLDLIKKIDCWQK